MCCGCAVCLLCVLCCVPAVNVKANHHHATITRLKPTITSSCTYDPPTHPPGKGVSSSAALEVSVMTALAAAHGLELGGRELALLCQKVCVCV
jgi:galactokinase